MNENEVWRNKKKKNDDHRQQNKEQANTKETRKENAELIRRKGRQNKIILCPSLPIQNKHDKLTNKKRSKIWAREGNKTWTISKKGMRMRNWKTHKI